MLKNQMKRLATTTCMVFLFTLFTAFGQSPWDRIGSRPPTLGVEHGESRYTLNSFVITLVDASQTVKKLSPLSDTSFDYTPGDRLSQRDRDRLYHLGDINLMLRKEGETEWTRYSTATRRQPVEKLAVSGFVLAAANLANTLPATIPVTVNRYWETDQGDLVLRFEITNTSSVPVEIGSLGIPLIFNNILEGKTLDEAHHDNVFFDPYIGQDAGYLQVNRLHGRGRACWYCLIKTPVLKRTIR